MVLVFFAEEVEVAEVKNARVSLIWRKHLTPMKLADASYQCPSDQDGDGGISNRVLAAVCVLWKSGPHRGRSRDREINPAPSSLTQLSRAERFSMLVESESAQQIKLRAERLGDTQRVLPLCRALSICRACEQK